MLFDVEDYVKKYRGYALLQRLLYIGEKSDGTDCLNLALKICMEGMNTDMFQQIVKALRNKGTEPTSEGVDSFVESANRKASLIQKRLETDLNGYKANLVKDGIRSAHLDLGHHHMARGNIQAALKSFVRARDFCTTSAHVVEMCMNVITAAANLNNFVHVTNYAAKAEQTFVGSDAPDAM